MGIECLDDGRLRHTNPECEPDAYAEPKSNPHPDAYTYTYSHTNAYSDADTNSHPDADTYSKSDSSGAAR